MESADWTIGIARRIHCVRERQGESVAVPVDVLASR